MATAGVDPDEEEQMSAGQAYGLSCSTISPFENIGYEVRLMCVMESGHSYQLRSGEAPPLASDRAHGT